MEKDEVYECERERDSARVSEREGARGRVPFIPEFLNMDMRISVNTRRESARERVSRRELREFWEHNPVQDDRT